MLRAASLLWRNKRNQTYVLYRENLSNWQGVTVILALATILAILAFSFDSGMSQKILRQAQDTVPLNVSIRTGPALIRPLDVGGVGDYENLLAGSSAYPILRSATTVRNQSTVSDSLSLLGLSPEAVAKLPAAPINKLSAIITSPNSKAELGVDTGTSKAIVVTLRGIPKEVDLIGWFRTPRGTHLSVTFSGHGNLRSLIPPGQIPANSSLIAFEFRETSDYLSRRLHAMGEGNFALPILKGTGSVIGVTFDGVRQSLPQSIWHIDNFPYAFDGGGLYVRPTIPASIPRVVVDPTTAALSDNGLLTLTGAEGSFFQVRVGAVSKTFPSAGVRFVIMNITDLQNALANVDLGAIDPIELWISTPNASKYVEKLKTSQLAGLEVQSQNAVEKDLKSDPRNLGLSGSYKVVLCFALILALFMYISALPLLYRENREVLFQLEADGLGPRRLRIAFRDALRLTTLVALMWGTGIGLLIAHLFISTSTPWMSIFFFLATSFVLSEAGGHLLSQRYFHQSTLIGS